MPTAPTTNRRAGVLTASINGAIYDIVDLKYSLSTVKRETLIGQSGVQGYKETPMQGSVEMTIRDANAISAKTFELFTTATVVVNLANGKTVTAVNCWLTDAVTIDTAEGSFSVKFEGSNVIEF